MVRLLNGEQTPRLTVSTEEAAQMLGISYRLAKAMVADHRIPVLRLGRAVRIPRQWVLDQVAQAMPASAERISA